MHYESDFTILCAHANAYSTEKQPRFPRSCTNLLYYDRARARSSIYGVNTARRYSAKIFQLGEGGVDIVICYLRYLNIISVLYIISYVNAAAEFSTSKHYTSSCCAVVAVCFSDLISIDPKGRNDKKLFMTFVTGGFSILQALVGSLL